MNPRAKFQPRNPLTHRAQWRSFAEAVLAGLDRDEVADLPDADRAKLGDLAATARIAWNFPAAGPVGRVAAPLPECVLSWSRQTSSVLRREIAPGVRFWADYLIQLLALVEAVEPDAAAPIPHWLSRADLA